MNRLLKLIGAIEAAIAKALFFPILAAIRSGTGLSRTGFSFGLFIASLLSGAYAMISLDYMLFAAALLIQALILFAFFVMGRFHQRTISLIRIPFLFIFIGYAIPALFMGQGDILVPIFFYLVSEYNLMIPGPPKDERGQ
ncbi:MAG: hypothetical protein CL472_07250 [Acidobacteria bacterium]|nr:hypothetical protein [Acidobacteriota bacterium]